MTAQRCIDCDKRTSRAGGLRCRACYFALARERSRQSFADRFWAKVDRRGPDECWPWLGERKKDPGGEYGVLRVGGTYMAAHRASYLIANGLLADVVRHSCDNPPCVNPAHLLGGTQIDNIRDRVDRGRSAKENPSIRGENHWRARRRQEQVA